MYGTCSGSTVLQGSFAMVDASQFSGTDICARIRTSIGMFYSSGGPNYNYGIIVDARGVNPGTSQGCSDSPWDLTVQPHATVILLPSGTITTSNTWTMPSQARLIGEGPGQTVLQANFTANDMIDMGNSTLCPTRNDCPAIAVEHLALNGNSESGVNGIVNNYGQELSYVNDVSFSLIKGTALSLNQNTSNSGPYSNLMMSNVGTCVNINGPQGIRGIHGLTCNTNTSSSVAILLNGSNISLEDMSLTGSSGSNTDGIQIGGVASASAQNNVLFNISGTGFTNLIHIENNTGTINCPGQTSLNGSTVNNVCDITILGVTNGSGNTVYDQVSNTTLTDSHLGMYILGEPVQYGTGSSTNNVFLGYSHFTTSLNWPTWLVGASQPSPLTSCPNVGSLYSVSGSGAAPTLLECESSGWVSIY